MCMHVFLSVYACVHVCMHIHMYVCMYGSTYRMGFGYALDITHQTPTKCMCMDTDSGFLLNNPVTDGNIIKRTNVTYIVNSNMCIRVCV
jgi:hypothetical protein